MNSIRTKLLIWLMIPLVGVAAFVSLETFYSSKKISNDLNDRTLLAASLTILEHVISTNGNLLADATLASLTDSLGDRFFYHVRGPNGAFVTGYSEYPRPPKTSSIQQGAPIFYDGTHQGIAVRVVQLQQDLTERELNGITTITTWQHITKRGELTVSLFTTSLARLVVLVLAAGAIVWFAVLAGLRPLTRLQSAIDSRTPYDLNPIRRSMPKELSGIVGSMNELFARVARSKKNRERFIGDAAHQLRNPVAAIKIQAQTSLESGKKTDLESGLHQILDVSDKSADMINKMLSGANAHAMDRSHDDEFDLVELVKETVAEAALAAFDKGQEVSVTHAQDSVLFKGNRTLLGEALFNLIDNASRYNDEHTMIEIAVDETLSQIEIGVSDTGRSFTEEEFLELSQPFLTGSTSMSGSGLGLSIAKDIAKSHGGYLTTTPQPNGKSISIILPKN